MDSVWILGVLRLYSVCTQSASHSTTTAAAAAAAAAAATAFTTEQSITTGAIGLETVTLCALPGLAWSCLLGAAAEYLASLPGDRSSIADSRLTSGGSLQREPRLQSSSLMLHCNEPGKLTSSAWPCRVLLPDAGALKAL